MAETKSVCSSLRSNPWLWALRVAQLLISVAVLALAAVNAQDYTRAGCTVPTRLQYSIAAVSSPNPSVNLAYASPAVFLAGTCHATPFPES